MMGHSCQACHHITDKGIGSEHFPRLIFHNVWGVFSYRIPRCVWTFDPFHRSNRQTNCFLETSQCFLHICIFVVNFCLAHPLFSCSQDLTYAHNKCKRNLTKATTRWQGTWFCRPPFMLPSTNFPSIEFHILNRRCIFSSVSGGPRLPLREVNRAASQSSGGTARASYDLSSRSQQPIKVPEPICFILYLSRYFPP